jgi:hypothetical protein
MKCLNCGMVLRLNAVEGYENVPGCLGCGYIHSTLTAQNSRDTVDAIVGRAIVEAARREFPCPKRASQSCSHCPFGSTCDAVQLAR